MPPPPLAAEVILDVISKAGALFFRWDPFFGLTYLSPNVRMILGYDPDELIGDPALVARVVDPEFLPRLEQLAADFYIASTDAVRIEIPYIARSGARVPLDTRVVPEIGESGAIIGFVGIALNAVDARARPPAEADGRRQGPRASPRTQDSSSVQPL